MSTTFFVYQLKVRRSGSNNMVDGLLESCSRCPGPHEARILIFDLVGTLGGPEVGLRFFSDPLYQSLIEANKYMHFNNEPSAAESVF